TKIFSRQGERRIQLQRAPEFFGAFLVLELLKQGHADVVRAISIFSRGLRGRILDRWASIAGKQTANYNKRAQYEEKTRSHRMLLAPYTQGIGDPVDIVEPGRNERDLQDGFVIESGGAQNLVIAF